MEFLQEYKMIKFYSIMVLFKIMIGKKINSQVTYLQLFRLRKRNCNNVKLMNLHG